MNGTLVTIVLDPITCYKCGVTFGIDRETVARRRQDHQSFWCPNGHSQYFPGQSEAEKLRGLLAREKHSREQAEERARDNWRAKEAVQRRLSATKAVVTRQKKKISAGRCPCCSHQFKNLELHMRRHHPKWSPEQEVEARAAKAVTK